MSATVHSRIVGSQELFPRGINDDENKDVAKLVPWVFEHACIAGTDCTMLWPSERAEFRDFFDFLDSFHCDMDDPNYAGMPATLDVTDKIKLPRKSWTAPKREGLESFIRFQGVIIKTLLSTIYYVLADTIADTPKLRFLPSKFQQTYALGGQRYASRYYGAVTIGLGDLRLPVISFAGYDDQSWNQLLQEIISVMLGQIAQGIAVQPQIRDRAVFVAGFYGRHFYIARGYFSADLITRVRAKGFSEKDHIEIQFTRGYDLAVKEAWLEAVEFLAGLFRYLIDRGFKIDP